MADFDVLDEKFVFASGLVHLQVMSVGKPVVVEDVVAKRIPNHCQDFVLEFGERVEGDKIQRHYLEIAYPYRDLINVQPRGWDGEFGSLIPGCFWRRTDKSRISALIQNAADHFWGAFDQAPVIALVPPSVKSPDSMVLGGCCEGQKIVIRVADWLPRACIVVAGREDVR